MKRLLLLSILLLTACTKTTFDWSEGDCQTKEDCIETELGCGPTHIMCTSDPEKYKNQFSTCEIIEDHPKNQNYKCTCIKHKCGWEA